MRRRTVLGLAAGATVAAPFVSRGQAQQRISLRLSSNDRPSGHSHMFVQWFAEGVAQRTDGAVRIQVFPNHTLANGNFRTEFELTRAGTIDIAVNSTIIFALFVDPRFDVFSLPFHVGDLDEFERMVAGPMGQKIGQWAGEHGLTALGLGINGFRQLTNSKRPVTRIDDMRGLKFRVPGSELFLSAFRTMGADAVTMNAQEMIQAMAQGVVDGQENPFISIMAFRMWEARQRYVTHWNYIVDPMAIHMSTRRFESLPQDVRAIMVEEAGRAGRRQMALAKELDENAVKELRTHGVQIVVPAAEAMAEFRARLGPLADQFADRIGRDNIELMRSEVARIRRELGRS
jgi:tripartite ATP-independent transporter DctP family solute receptor